MKLAVIGLGQRMSYVVKLMMDMAPGSTFDVADPNEAGVRQWMEVRKLSSEGVTVYRSADEVLAHADRYDGVVIGTRCNLHTPMAVKAAATGLPLYLEKPVAVNWNQLEALHRAFAGREDNVVVSFPLRVTPLFKAVQEIVQSGRLGEINQVQAFNNVSYGGVYYSQGYRDYDVTGGLWLQKATHDFDYINALLGARPITIAAMMSRKCYGGDKPHDLVCSRCDDAEQCAESPQGMKMRGDTGGVGPDDHLCCFSRDIKNQDAGSAIVMYDSGVHANYTQNFVARRTARARGATIIGYKATLHFDWCTEVISVTDHHQERVDSITVKTSTGHSGGDHVLVQNFIDVVRGKCRSNSDLHAGLLSASMCLAARDAAHSGQYQAIRHFDGRPAPSHAGGTPVIRGRELEPVA